MENVHVSVSLALHVECVSTYSISSPSNHNWWVHSEFQDGCVNIGVERFRSREVLLSWWFRC